MGFGDIVKKGIRAIPGVGDVAGFALDVGGALLNKGAADDAGEAARAAEIATGKLEAGKAEDSRQAAITAAGGMMPQMQAKGFMGLSPEIMAQLGQRRDYSDLIEQGAVDRTAGSGKAFLAGLAGDASAAIDQHAVNEAIKAVGQGGVGTPDDPALSTAEAAHSMDFPVSPEEEGF